MACARKVFPSTFQSLVHMKSTSSSAQGKCRSPVFSMYRTEPNHSASSLFGREKAISPKKFLTVFCHSRSHSLREVHFCITAAACPKSVNRPPTLRSWLWPELSRCDQHVNHAVVELRDAIEMNLDASLKPSSHTWLATWLSPVSRSQFADLCVLPYVLILIHPDVEKSVYH